MKKKPTQPIEPKIIRRKISDYIPDAHNPNKGTERGLAMIEDGLNELGAGRSLVADRNDKIPAGNKTLEAAQLAGITDVIEIETDGHALIVHKRSDWDLDDPTGAARRYSFLDNQSGLQMAWDVAQVARHAAEGTNLTGVFYDWELDKMVGNVPDLAADPSTLWQGMPEFNQQDATAFFSLKIHFNTQADLDAFAQLVGQKINPETKYIYYPPLERANLKRGQIGEELEGGEE